MGDALEPLKSPIEINIHDGSELCLHSNPGAFIECHGTCDDEPSLLNGAVAPCLMSMDHEGERIRADDRHTIDCWHWNITAPPIDPDVSPGVLRFAGCKYGINDVQMTDAGKYTCKLAGGSSVDRRSVSITVSGDMPNCTLFNFILLLFRFRESNFCRQK